MSRSTLPFDGEGTASPYGCRWFDRFLLCSRPRRLSGCLQPQFALDRRLEDGDEFRVDHHAMLLLDERRQLQGRDIPEFPEGHLHQFQFVHVAPPCTSDKPQTEAAWGDLTTALPPASRSFGFVFGQVDLLQRRLGHLRNALVVVIDGGEAANKPGSLPRHQGQQSMGLGAAFILPKPGASPVLRPLLPLAEWHSTAAADSMP